MCSQVSAAYRLKLVNFIWSLIIKMSSLEKHYTRFRAYQLGAEGSSFSYYDGSYFTLIEARLNEVNKPNVISELNQCGLSKINCLHITSWDADHCAEKDLKDILLFEPNKIEYPGYEPHTDTAKACLKLITAYKNEKKDKKVVRVDPPYIKTLEDAHSWGYKNILFHPKYISENSNDNSTVKLFRSGSFNVASLGDVDSNVISASLRTYKTFYSEIDIMILAHHGADNGFTTSAFIKKVQPTIAVCSSNYDNKFEHPKEEIRELLHKNEIPIYTSKTGDIVIVSLPPHTSKFKVFNLISNSTEISSEKIYTTKKSKTLSHNYDTVRNIYQGNKRPFKGF